MTRKYIQLLQLLSGWLSGVECHIASISSLFWMALDAARSKTLTILLSIRLVRLGSVQFKKHRLRGVWIE